MTRLVPYLALASFPVADLLALNPVRFSWGFHHGSEPMPVEVRDKAERVATAALLCRGNLGE